MEILKALFIEWELGTWADVLQIIGFAISVLVLVVGLFIKSDIEKLKTNYIFDKRINDHIKNLTDSSSTINNLLNNYNHNRNAIKTEFSTCQVELEDLATKLSFWQSKKCKRLISFIKKRKDKPFSPRVEYKNAVWAYIIKYPKKMYATTYDDTWIVYNGLIEVIRQMENIRKNKRKSL